MPDRLPLAAILLVLAAGLAAVACSGGSNFSSASPPIAPSGPAASAGSPTAAAQPTITDQTVVGGLQQAIKDVPLDLASGTKLGRDDAPIKLETFVDFQCPFCLKFTALQEPQLINEYVKTGKLQIIVRPFPIFSGNESVVAAVASECAAVQNKFWPYYEQLYLSEAQAGQATHEQINVGRFSRANLIKFATQLKLDVATFTTCLDGNQQLSAVQDSVRAGQQYGITSTPGFAINGGQPFSGLPRTIDYWHNLFGTILGSSSSGSSA